MKKTFNCSFLIVLFAMVCTCSILPALSQSSDGKKLLIKHACANCHLIEGQGGFIGPPLDGIGAHRDENYIIYKLTVRPLPRRKKLFPVPYELMSHVHVPDADAATVGTFATCQDALFVNAKVNTVSSLFGIGWGYLIDKFPNKSLQYFAGNDTACTIPKRKTFRCRRGIKDPTLHNQSRMFKDNK